MSTIRLDESDAGRPTDLAPGDRVEVTLAETATTGYRWQWLLPAAVQELTDEYDPAPPGRPGQGGARRLLVELLVAGRHRLRAELRRSWEPDPIRVLDFDLDVRQH